MERRIPHRPPSPLDLLTTGIPRLDPVLGGGLSSGDALLVVGEAGAGKTTFALQVAFHSAASGRPACFVSTTSESSSKLLAHARAYGFYDEALIGNGLFLLSVYPLIEQGLDAVRAALEREVGEHGARVLVLDGLMTLHDLHPEPRELRRFLYELASMLWARGCTLLLTSSRSDPVGLHDYSEFTTADSLVRLAQRVEAGRSLRSLQVVKARGRTPLLGLHTLRLDRRGLAVFPRFESLERGREIPAVEGRVASGLPEFDAMVAGGLPAGSVTALAGSVGTGKTLFALQFLLEGARRGECGLLLSLRETEAELVRKARAFGLDLETPLAEGAVVVEHRSPVDLSVDEVVAALRESLDRVGCRRFALDGVAELVGSIPEEPRRAALMSVLSGLLRGRGVTAVIPAEVSQVVGPELDLGRTPLAGLAQNLVLLRYVEYGGELYRILSFLKARDSDFDPSIRRYAIEPSGLRVIPTSGEADPLLAGIASLASEARVKRSRDEAR
jgi:circadian clock protein KaiC